MTLGVVEEALSSTVVGGVPAVLVVVDVSVGEDDLVGAGEPAAAAGAEGAAGTVGVGADFDVVGEAVEDSEGTTSDGKKDESRFPQNLDMRFEPFTGDRFVVDCDLGNETFGAESLRLRRVFCSAERGRSLRGSGTASASRELGPG
jgi:hypothetical protein